MIVQYSETDMSGIGPSISQAATKPNAVNLVKQLVKVSETEMSEAAVRWQRWRKKYRRGLKYLTEDSLTNRTPLYSTNYLYGNVETVKSNLCRALPPISLRGVESSDEQAASLLLKVLEDSLKEANFQNAEVRWVHHGSICGYGVMKVSYDPNAYRGLGNNRFEVVLNEDFLLDPWAVHPDESRWVIHRRRNVSVDEIWSLYGKWVEPEGRNAKEGFAYDMEPSQQVGGTATLYECWLKKWREGGKFDWYVISVAGDTLLDFRKNPYDHGMLPFSVWYPAEDDAAENAYLVGIGEIEEIEPLQDLADVLDVQFYQAVKKQVNRQRVVSMQSGIGQVSDDPGRVYYVQGDVRQAMAWDNPPGIGHEALIFRQSVPMQMQVVSGITDAMAGRRPVGIVAGRAVERLQDAGAMRIFFKQVGLAQALRRVLQMALSNIFQYYEDDRIVRISTGKDMRVLGKYPDALKLPKNASDDVKAEILAAREQFKASYRVDLVLEDISQEYDIIIETDSPLPTNRQDRAQIAFDLWRTNALDRKAILDVYDWPGRDEILARMGALETAAMAGQMPGVTQGGVGHFGARPNVLADQNAQAIAQEMAGITG